MKKTQTKTTSLVVKGLVGTAFLLLFMLNIVVVAPGGNKGGKLSLSSLTAFAFDDPTYDSGGGSGSSSGSGSGTGGTSCYTRTVIGCPPGLGGPSAVRVVCDITGYYNAGETCTPVDCVRGAREPLECRRY